MFKLLKNAFKISITNLIMLMPLLLFLFILNIYLLFAKGAINNIISAILFYLTLFLMVSAFASGWFNMIKTAIYNFKNEVKVSEYNSFKLLNEFPVGISEYIKSFLGFSLLYLLVADIVFYLVYLAGAKFIGSTGVSLAQLVVASGSYQDMALLLSHLSKTELLRLNYWYLFIIFAVQIFMLFTIFWPVEILYSTKNPIMAFFRSISRVFKNPEIILIFIILNIINFVLTIVNYFAMINPITYFIMTLIIFGFIMYVFVLLFLYYEEKVQSNSDSSTDSDG